jgi:hypothetical protein
MHAVFANIKGQYQCSYDGVPSTASVTISCSQSRGKFGSSDLSTNMGPEFPHDGLVTNMPLLSPHVC